MPVLIFILLGSLFFTGCTAIPLDQAPPSNPAAFGPAVPLRVCVLRDIDLDQDAADRLLAVLRERFTPYGLMLEFPWIRDWQRPAAISSGVNDDASGSVAIFDSIPPVVDVAIIPASEPTHAPRPTSQAPSLELQASSQKPGPRGPGSTRGIERDQGTVRLQASVVPFSKPS